MAVGNYKEIQIARALTESIFSNSNSTPKISVVTKKADEKSIKPQVSFIFVGSKQK